MTTEEDNQLPGPGGRVEIRPERALSDVSNRFHISSIKASHRLDINQLSYEVDERGSGFLQRFIKLENPFKGSREGPKKKRILHDISFDTCSGQLLAILGSSGSGKTTLLDVIACQTSTGQIEGLVKLDGIARTQETIKSSSAYVRQDDRLLPHLTVKETLNFVAELKLPKSWSTDKRNKRVNSVIAELGLRHVTNSKVGGADIRGISGGERRRVSIGIQLLLNPSILFLDEPTSGLDSFTAHNLVETLAKLARNNRIVIMTIHQPRSDIYELFDQLILLSQGQMVYFGAAMEMISYFTNLGYPCPELTNPCDYYVDLATVDRKCEETEVETGRRVDFLIDLYNRRGNISDDDLVDRPDPPSYTATPAQQDIRRSSSGGSMEGGVRRRQSHIHVTMHDDVTGKEPSSKRNSQSSTTIHKEAVNVTDDEKDSDVDDEKDSDVDDEKDSDVDDENTSTDHDADSTSQNKLDDRQDKGASDLSNDQSQAASTTNLVIPPVTTQATNQYDNQAFQPDEDDHGDSNSGSARPDDVTCDVTDDVTGDGHVAPPPGRDADVYSMSIVSSFGGDQHSKVAIQDKPGFTLQFWVLLRRTLKNNLEDYGFLFVQAVEALFMSVIIGVIYWNLSLDQLGAKDRFGLLYVLAALYPYMVILDVIGKYYKERFILYYEMVDGLYTPAPYFFAKVLGDIPEHTVFIIFYCLPVYFLSGLQMDAALFFQQFALVYMIVLCSRSLALFASAVMAAYPVSVLIAQSIFSMFLLSSGFIFNLDNIFIGMKWVSYISYIKWGYQAMCETEFTGLNFTCSSAVPETCVEDGQDALEAYSLAGGAIWQSSLVMLAEIFLFFSLFFVGVRFKSQKPTQQ